MDAPQACVAVEITGSPAPAEQRASLERRCSDILGARRCRIVAPGDIGMGGPACWQVIVTREGGDTPISASVVLNDVTDPQHVPVRRDVTFRSNDAVHERWATLGLVIAALVTVEEHSAAEETPATPFNSAGGGFAPAVEAQGGGPPGAAQPGPLTGEARVSAVGALGLLPQPALGVRVEGSLARRPVALVARATVFPTDSRTTFSARGAGGDVQLVAAGLGLCGVGGENRLSARACLGGDAVRTRASGFGVSQTNAVIAWWGSAWASASLELRLIHRLALTFDVEGAVLFERPTFGIHGAPSTFTTSPVEGALAAGLAVPF